MQLKARTIALTAFLGLTFSAFAQGPEVTSAAIAVDRNDLESAKQHIDEAKTIVDEKGVQAVSERNLQKYYWRRGQIYYRLFNQSKQNQAIDISLLDESISNLTALIDYNKSVREDDYEDDARPLLQTAIGDIVGLAGSYAQSESTRGQAYELFAKVYDLKSKPALGSEVDTATLYNMATLAAQMGDTNTVIEHYKTLIDLGYKGRTWSAMYQGNRVGIPDKATLDQYLEQGLVTEPELSEAIDEALYVQTILWLNVAGQKEDFNKYLTEARAKFPENGDLVLFQLQDYLDNKDYDGALANLNQLLEEEPANALYLYNKGYILHVYKEDGQQGLEFYKKAYEPDSNYIDAVYQAGVVYVEMSNAKVEEINDLPTNASNAAYNKLVDEKKALLEEALKYLLIAEGIDANDTATITSLSEVYYKLGNAEKALEYRKKSQQ